MTQFNVQLLSDREAAQLHGGSGCSTTVVQCEGHPMMPPVKRCGTIVPDAAIKDLKAKLQVCLKDSVAAALKPWCA